MCSRGSRYSQIKNQLRAAFVPYMKCFLIFWAMFPKFYFKVPKCTKITLLRSNFFGLKKVLRCVKRFEILWLFYNENMPSVKKSYGNKVLLFSKSYFRWILSFKNLKFIISIKLLHFTPIITISSKNLFFHFKRYCTFRNLIYSNWT